MGPLETNHNKEITIDLSEWFPAKNGLQQDDGPIYFSIDQGKPPAAPRSRFLSFLDFFSKDKTLATVDEEESCSDGATESIKEKLSGDAKKALKMKSNKPRSPKKESTPSPVPLVPFPFHRSGSAEQKELMLSRTSKHLDMSKVNNIRFTRTKKGKSDDVVNDQVDTGKKQRSPRLLGGDKVEAETTFVSEGNSIKQLRQRKQTPTSTVLFHDLSSYAVHPSINHLVSFSGAVNGYGAQFKQGGLNTSACTTKIDQDLSRTMQIAFGEQMLTNILKSGNEDFSLPNALPLDSILQSTDGLASAMMILIRNSAPPRKFIENLDSYKISLKKGLETIFQKIHDEEDLKHFTRQKVYYQYQLFLLNDILAAEESKSQDADFLDPQKKSKMSLMNSSSMRQRPACVHEFMDTPMEPPVCCLEIDALYEKMKDSLFGQHKISLGDVDVARRLILITLSIVEVLFKVDRSNLLYAHTYLANASNLGLDSYDYYCIIYQLSVYNPPLTKYMRLYFSWWISAFIYNNTDVYLHLLKDMQAVAQNFTDGKGFRFSVPRSHLEINQLFSEPKHRMTLSTGPKRCSSVASIDSMASQQVPVHPEGPSSFLLSYYQELEDNPSSRVATTPSASSNAQKTVGNALGWLLDAHFASLHVNNNCTSGSFKIKQIIKSKKLEPSKDNKRGYPSSEFGATWRHHDAASISTPLFGSALSFGSVASGERAGPFFTEKNISLASFRSFGTDTHSIA